MNKRDLKADLELCNKATPGPWEFGPIYAGTIAGELDEERHRANRELLNNFREGWPHAIERAIEAEALVRELREALNKIAYPVRSLQNEADEKNFSLDGRVATELANSSHWLKSIAKEVLGDEI